MQCFHYLPSPLLLFLLYHYYYYYYHYYYSPVYYVSWLHREWHGEICQILLFEIGQSEIGFHHLIGGSRREEGEGRRSRREEIRR